MSCDTCDDLENYNLVKDSADNYLVSIYTNTSFDYNPVSVSIDCAEDRESPD